MATEWISPTWRMPEVSNQSKFENYSLDFAGVASEYIDCGLNGTGTGSSEFALGSDLDLTISFWFKLSNITSGDGFVSWATTPTTGGTVFFLAAQNADKLNVLIENGWRYTSSSLTADQWYNFTATRSSLDNTWRFYLDNGIPATWSDGGTLARQTYATNFYLGSGYGGSGGYEGSLAQCTVFNYVLSESQRNYLWNSGTPINPMAISGQPPVAYYPLGGSSTGSASTLTIPNESVADATVFNFIESSSQYINLGTNVSSLMPTGAFSFSLWTKLDAVSIGAVIGLFSANSSGGADGYLLWKENTVDKLQFAIDDGGFKWVTHQTPLVADAWYHIVCTWDGSSTSKIYLNTVVSSAAGSPTSISYNATTINKIGDYNGYEIDGQMSNVMFWDTELSQANVTTLYNNGVPLLTGTQPQAANLKAWYPMNVDNATWNGSNWIIEDSSTPYSGTINFQI